MRLVRRSLEGPKGVRLGKCPPEERKDLSNSRAAMTHCVLLLIEKLGNCSSIWEQEHGVVTEASASPLAVKDSTVDALLRWSERPLPGLQ